MSDIIASVGSQLSQQQQAPVASGQQVAETLGNTVSGQQSANPVQAATPSAEAQNTPDQGTMEQFARNLNQNEQIRRRGLRFQVDREVGKTIINVVDRNSDEVVRQIPAKEVLQVARFLKEQLDTDPQKALSSIGLSAYA